MGAVPRALKAQLGIAITPRGFPLAQVSDDHPSGPNGNSVVSDRNGAGQLNLLEELHFERLHLSLLKGETVVWLPIHRKDSIGFRNKRQPKQPRNSEPRSFGFDPYSRPTPTTCAKS